MTPTMRKVFYVAACLLPAVLAGCQATASLQGVGAAIPGAVGQLDDTVYDIAIAKYRSAQRFQAEVKGTMPTLPPLPVITAPK